MSQLFKDRWTVISAIIILIMGAEIVFLIKQNRELRSVIQNPREHFETLKESETVLPFAAQDVDGNTIAVEYGPDAPYTMLFWLSPDCSVCKDNIPFWNHLMLNYDESNIRYFGLCDSDKDEVRAYIDEYDISFTVLCPVSSEIVESYKGEILPQTLLISPGGQILKVWPGSLARMKEDQILAMLKQL